MAQDGCLPAFRNFLIICPEQEGGASASDEWVAALATCLNKHGFTYVARSGQDEPDDDSSGVRYLPLGESLPAFGLMTAVIVIQDALWAARATVTYPNADIYLLTARPTPSRIPGRLPVSMIIGRTCVSACMRWPEILKLAESEDACSSVLRPPQSTAETRQGSLPIARL